jgi:hypothetical protein
MYEKLEEFVFWKDILNIKLDPKFDQKKRLKHKKKFNMVLII